MVLLDCLGMIAEAFMRLSELEVLRSSTHVEEIQLILQTIYLAVSSNKGAFCAAIREQPFYPGYLVRIKFIRQLLETLCQDIDHRTLRYVDPLKSKHPAAQSPPQIHLEKLNISP
jgi:hypothetical protein